MLSIPDHLSILISLLLCIQSTSFAFNPTKNPQITPCEFDSVLTHELQNILDSERENRDLQGISASIIMPDQRTWRGVSGLSEAEEPDSIRPDMLFSIASITKTFTAALLLQLVEENRLDLGDSIYQWLPAFEHIDSTITIRQLLNHTSGVFSFHENPACWDSLFSNPDRFWSPEEMIETFIEYPYFPPGEGWHYSNTNYLLLGMIICTATDSEVSDQLGERFFEPFDLNHTFLDIEDELVGDLAHGWHDLDDDGERDDIYFIPRTSWYSALWTGGAMVSTAEDISIWSQALYGGEVLDQASLEEMLDFGEIPHGWNPITGYGLGVELFELYGRELWGHAGDIPGYNSLMIYLPEDSVSITVLVNSDVDNSSNEIGYRLLEAILDYLDAPPPPSSLIP
ncbi:beta-lactamase family protein, partial [bacterium]|nr:beta-lactamase family protein [bacterium]